MSDRLFTPRFFVMCAFTFTVFISLFQLLPTAPYHVLSLGGSTTAAGLFLGLLTFASAGSAPFTGPLADRLGHRRVLITVSATLTLFSLSYAVITDYRLLLAVVFLHGLFWSGLLSASGAYMTMTLPAHRRAEGLGYWGMMSILALGVAPTVGFAVYHQGWVTLCVELAVLNLAMAAIAWRLPDDRVQVAASHVAGAPRPGVEWKIVWLGVALGLIAFGYGGLTSFAALFTDSLHITPKSLYLTVMAVTILVARFVLGRSLDRIGHRRALLPCLAAPAVGLAILTVARGPAGLIASSIVFSAGFGLMWPSFTALVLSRVDSNRRGAAYGAIIAAFDTGIGTGSTSIGWIIRHGGFRMAFGVAALLAAAALPYYLFAERRLGFRTEI